MTTDYPGVTNFSRVDGMVACGGATEVAALDAIKHDGFATVVNFRLASEPGANIEQFALTYIAERQR